MRYLILFPALFFATAPVVAQRPAPEVRRQITAADYARAERFLRAGTAPLVFGTSVRATWLDNDRFWYRNDIPDGTEFVLVDPARRSRTRAFDHVKLAAALSAAADTSYAPFALPFTTFLFSPDGKSITFDVRGRHFTCDVQGTQCTASRARRPRPDRNAVVSPDSSHAAFIRDYNLWVRDVATGAETQLTTDGIKDFGYATNNAGWTKSDRPVLLWSPDSKEIATFQMDERGVGDMYLVSTAIGHPRLEAWKYPLPEDTVIFRIQRVVIHLDGPRVVRLQMPPDQHRSTICDDIACRGSDFSDVEWSADASQLAFVSSSRDHKHANLRVADPETGAVRDVMEESADTFFESGFNLVNWHMLAKSNEVIWYSQRDNWGHLYLYDLTTGQLKNRITSGAWNVLQLLRIDEQTRTLYFLGAGREPGDPYFRYLYSVRMDGSRLALLTPDSADHEVTLSPSGRYFVDSYSTPTIPPVTVLRDARGRKVADLEKADITKLVATGWTPPIPITVKARDNTTDLYGLMYLPTNFDSMASYPIINYVYPGPQTGSVGSRQFTPSRGDKRSLAELGFVVVEVDAMGTPMRSKAFHAAYYGNMGDNGLPDQIAAIKQLARAHRWMDLNRVGIYGHSGGGYAAADAILRYPDFYKVAVSQAGNHDNRTYEDDWGEKWQGLLKTNPDGSTNYDNQANAMLARNLKGKLLIANGSMDNNVPPNNTWVLVDSLIAANKDFDYILFPNRRHPFGNEPYMMRRRWDYFVRNLMGAEPPKEYEFTPEPAPRRPQ
jgi:dipeptidyl aminopeptidase/acylaminoacyl peptidase